MDSKERFDNEFQGQAQQKNNQDEAQKVKNRTSLVFWSAYQTMTVMIVLVRSWNIKLKWLMNLFLNLPLLKSVDEIWVCISTVVDLGNSENDVSSVIGYFNLMVFEIFDKNHILTVFYTQSQRICFSGKMIQWWNMNKSSIDETHHESVNAVDSFENKAFVKSIILTQYIYDSVNACIKAYFIHDNDVH